MTEQEAQVLFDAALGEARKHGVEDLEIYFASEESALTRFANNTIHQNVNEDSRMISVRAAIGHRTARATTNRPANVVETVRRAIALTKASEPDRNLVELYDGAPIEPIDRWDEATAFCRPSDRGEAVRAAIACVEEAGHIAAGILSTSRTTSILANSRGVFARHDETGAVFSITATGKDSSGWAKASSVRLSEFDPVALAKSAAEKASKSARPRRLEPGKYRVLLEPAAVLDFAGQIFGDCTATAIEEERSFLTGRMDKPIFGPNITIHDSVRHPLQDGAPFDGEGVPRLPLVLFAGGIPGEMPYGRAAARRASVAPTGHGLSLPCEGGESLQNIVIEGGTDSREELLRKLGNGILVTRLWYIREVDPFRKVMTGMTRDGTFLVENGEVVCGLHNFRFNESVVDALQRVEAMSPTQRSSGEEAFDMAVPAMLIDGFSFSEVTLF